MKLFALGSLLFNFLTYTLIPSDEIEPLYSDFSIQALVDDLPKGASLEDPYLLLVNRDNPLESDEGFELAYSSGGKPYHIDLVEPLQELLEVAADDGHSFTIVSGYRSMAEQAQNIENLYQVYLADGLSEADARMMANQFVAPADASEHSTGLALDLIGDDWEGFDGALLHQRYGEWESAHWLANHAHEFGFILRYPQEKIAITGFEYEPWHFRYVGIPHATFMYEHGLSLEEYLSLIQLRKS